MLLFSFPGRLYCKMIRFTVALLFGSLVATAQIRMSKLEVPAGETFVMEGTDTIEVDSLVLGDSASIHLNREKLSNYIHAKVLSAGKSSRILGHGDRGPNGKNGMPGTTPDGPCLKGTPGRHGANGEHGKNGTNLFLYVTSFVISGDLTVDLNGGNGGDAGKGGLGGGGSAGTRVCVGGTGGPGGNGGNGGNGGSGGSLTISCKECHHHRLMLGNKLIVRTYAGYGGLGGDAGPGGLAGLGTGGPTSGDGMAGQRGRKGMKGITGKQGAINFEAHTRNE